jgi:uncharacterized protein (DUF2062 family)
MTAETSFWSRLGAWLRHLHFRLVTIEASPHAISLGVAIGIFFGFTPLWTLKTLLSIGFAWLLGGNKIAAAISVQLHDLLLPFMPAIYLWEYKLGYGVMRGHLPARVHLHHLTLREYFQWETFLTVGRPLLVGSIVIGLPSAVMVYQVCRGLVTRHRAQASQR